MPDLPPTLPRWDLTITLPDDAKWVPLLDSGPEGLLEAPDRLVVTDECTYGGDGPVGSRLDRVVTTLQLIKGTYRVKSLHAENDQPMGWLDFEEVRRIRYRERMRQALANVVRLTTPDGQVYTSAHPLPDAHPLWVVATVYATALALAQPPVVAVAEHFGISRDAAATRVQRARERGFLRPTEKGRAGA
jgi:hypothetical protein